MAETVTFETSLGDIVIELFSEQAPLSAENILSYVKAGFYDGTTIHRVIDNFVIQIGGIEADMGQRQESAPVKNEAGNGLKNERLTVGMGRMEGKDSATSHFYINLKHNAHLDHRDDSEAGFGYAVFGCVISGYDTVDRIAKVQTKEGVLDGESYPGLPVEPLFIIRAYLNE